MRLSALFLLLAGTGAAAAAAQNLRAGTTEIVAVSATGVTDKAPAAANATASKPPQYRGVNLGGWLVLESWVSWAFGYV